jgi:hypothetical protein
VVAAVAVVAVVAAAAHWNPAKDQEATAALLGLGWLQDLEPELMKKWLWPATLSPVWTAAKPQALAPGAVRLVRKHSQQRLSKMEKIMTLAISYQTHSCRELALFT